MIRPKGLVLDANILLRGVLGSKILQVLEAYDETVAFYSPDVCFQEARKHIPFIGGRRGGDVRAMLVVLERIADMIEVVDRGVYEDQEAVARKRMELRDPNDWHVLATALVLDVPIWTEDKDFFGSGVATWTTDRVELYLRDA